MSQELQTVQQETTMTVEQIKAQRSLIVNVMTSVMTKDIHYGIINGTKRPTIYKPGCEVLLSTFRIAIEPVVTDLSTTDEIKYRVECRGNSLSGGYLGSGIGECSSSEEKYKWRKVVCKEEFEQTPEDRRRKKWGKGEGGKTYTTDQVRMNPSDVANTILKMAKKRGISDFVLTVLAASEVFTQDYEDLPAEVREAVIGEQGPPPVQQPVRKSAAPAPSSVPRQTGEVISEAQRKRLYAIYKSAGVTDDQMKDYLFRNYSLESSADILRSDYEAICKWAGEGRAA